MAGVMGTRTGTAALAAVPETESGSVSSGVTCTSVRVARSSSTAQEAVARPTAPISSRVLAAENR